MEKVTFNIGLIIVSTNTTECTLLTVDQIGFEVFYVSKMWLRQITPLGLIVTGLQWTLLLDKVVTLKILAAHTISRNKVGRKGVRLSYKRFSYGFLFFIQYFRYYSIFDLQFFPTVA